METDFGNKILNISAKLFRERGFEAVTMNDISKNANVSENYLKENYQDKETIVNELASIFFKAQEKYCNSIQNYSSAKKEFIQIIEYCSGFYAKFTPFLSVEIKNNYPKAWILFLSHKNEVIIKKVKINLERGIKDGVYREIFDVDITAKLCVEQLQHAFNQLIFPLKDYSKKEVFNVLLKNQLYSICK